jgi:DNA polymerase III subunit alpha
MLKGFFSTYHNVHVHTDNSILDGVGFVEEYVKLAVQNRQGYVAVSDHGMAGAWPSLLDACEKSGIRPVFGVELYINDHHMLTPDFSNLSSEMQQKVRQNDHMLVFAENEKGYSNLIKLVSDSWETGFYHNPRVSWKQLSEHSDGLVATTGCLASPINRALSRESPEKAKDMLRKWNDVWQGRLWVEWQMIDIHDQDVNNPKLMYMAEDLGIPPLITNDVHYASHRDAELQKILLLIQSKGGTIDSPRGLQFDSDCHWYTSEYDMDLRWKAKYRNMMNSNDDFFNESKRQTLKLCQRCGYVNPDRSPKLPYVEGAEDKVREICEGSLKKLNIDNEKYRDRLEQEMYVIGKKQFFSYFMIQRDVICEGVRKTMGGDIGPGRGSVGGSLMAYLMGITQLDPVKHNLLFGRFFSFSRGGCQMCMHV